MVAVVKLLGIAMVAFAVAYLVRQDLMKKSMELWQKGNNLYLGGVLSILLGIILLIAASHCQVVWFVVVMGILSLLKGAGLFILGPEKMKKRMKMISSKPVGIQRLLAVSILVLGALLIYAA